MNFIYSLFIFILNLFIIAIAQIYILIRNNLRKAVTFVTLAWTTKRLLEIYKTHIRHLSPLELRGNNENIEQQHKDTSSLGTPQR